jgi:hypothetical protein
MEQNDTYIENSRLIYQETTAARNQQHEDISLINQKINWIFTSDVIFFGFLLQIHSRYNFLYIIAATLLIVSMAFCCWSIFARDYKMGPKLSELHEKRALKEIKEIDFLDSINNRIIKDLESNKNIVNNLAKYLKISTILLILAVVLVFMKFYHLCHI